VSDLTLILQTSFSSSVCSSSGIAESVQTTCGMDESEKRLQSL
jgi:hypothetical protein